MLSLGTVGRVGSLLLEFRVAGMYVGVQGLPSAPSVLGEPLDYFVHVTE